MEISIQSQGVFSAQSSPNRLIALGAREALPAENQDQVVSLDRYAASEPMDDSGRYSRDSMIKTMRATQEALLGVDLDDEFMPILGEKPAALERPESPGELDSGDKDLIQRLQQRDREVKLEEQTHARTAGKYVRSAPSYNYQMGPDGKMYAVGGYVAVDTGSTGNAAEDQIKSRTLRAAAMGVANPSAADAMVAMHAGNLETQNSDPLARSEFNEVA